MSGFGLLINLLLEPLFLQHFLHLEGQKNFLNLLIWTSAWSFSRVINHHYISYCSIFLTNTVRNTTCDRNSVHSSEPYKDINFVLPARFLSTVKMVTPVCKLYSSALQTQSNLKLQINSNKLQPFEGFSSTQCQIESLSLFIVVLRSMFSNQII